MIVSTIQVLLPWKIRQVWDAVTAVDQYPLWRSGLERVEVLSKAQFVEYTGSGFPTLFTTTVWGPCIRWEFDLDNSSMGGHWSGIFTERGAETAVTFTEQVAVKKFYLRPIVKSYLRRQQKRFVSDLESFLMRQGSGALKE